MANFEIRFQRGSTSRWEQLNPVLGAGEPGLAVDTGLLKIGDGVTPWNDLEAYLTAPYVEGIVETILAESGGGSADPRVGNLADLTTQDRSTIVAAINEINMAGVEFTLLYDNAKAG